MASRDELGAQERAVLDLVARNPFAGQQEIATALGLARSTVAAHVVSLTQKGYILGRGYVLPEPQRITVIGGAVLDRKYHARRELIFGTSNPMQGSRSFGGVARNVAENLARLEADVLFVSIVGDDEGGRALLAHLGSLGADVSQVLSTSERPTAEYAAILGPDNDLALGIADMDVFDLFQPSHIERVWPHLAASSWVFLDCNLPAETIGTLFARKPSARFRLAIDTVSTPKAAKLPSELSAIDLLFTNRDEARAILGVTRGNAEDLAATLRERGVAQVLVTMGAEGYVLATEDGISYHEPVPADPVDITGAGDAMIAGTLSRLLAGDPLPQAARTGALLATLTTESRSSVHPDLSLNFLAAGAHRLEH
ncbi:MAG: winged helix-turn-helix transcriptional regulator [Methylobacterium mesophilicum]|nr:winged helix-turn-helix transcriptional regulator [Methylobacterium mesophilicum]